MWRRRRVRRARANFEIDHSSEAACWYLAGGSARRARNTSGAISTQPPSSHATRKRAAAVRATARSLTSSYSTRSRRSSIQRGQLGHDLGDLDRVEDAPFAQVVAEVVAQRCMVTSTVIRAGAWHAVA